MYRVTVECTDGTRDDFYAKGTCIIVGEGRIVYWEIAEKDEYISYPIFRIKNFREISVD